MELEFRFFFKKEKRNAFAVLILDLTWNLNQIIQQATSKFILDPDSFVLESRHFYSPWPALRVRLEPWYSRASSARWPASALRRRSCAPSPPLRWRTASASFSIAGAAPSPFVADPWWSARKQSFLPARVPALRVFDWNGDYNFVFNRNNVNLVWIRIQKYGKHIATQLFT